jgi:hypothetical protein
VTFDLKMLWQYRESDTMLDMWQKSKVGNAANNRKAKVEQSGAFDCPC